MTLPSPNETAIPELDYIESPKELSPTDISVVVPVRNNAAGLRNMMAGISARAELQELGELIIVDDGSRSSIGLESLDTERIPPLRLVHTNGIGPAGARNKGVELAMGEWILFIDSDCVPSVELLSAYKLAMDGSVGYAGHIEAAGSDALSRYYDSQGTLVPFGIDKHGRPQHVVAGNTLIWARAFKAIGGFDNNFHLAAGEDVDLGFRLRQIGRLRYVPDATVVHDFGGLYSFFERFFRYGRGNAVLERKYAVSFLPKRQHAKTPAVIDRLLAFLQHFITLVGYHAELRIYETGPR